MALRPILTLPLCLAIDYGRYVLILPVIIGWGIILYVAGETLGYGIGELMLAPFFVIGYVAAVIDPRMSGAEFLDGEDHLAHWHRIIFLSGLILWGAAAAWHAVRRTTPLRRTLRERLGRATRLAGILALFVAVGLLAAVVRHGSPAVLFSVPFTFLLAACLAWWAVLVNAGAERLQEAIRGPDPLAASEPAVLPVDARAQE